MRPSTGLKATVWDLSTTLCLDPVSGFFLSSFSKGFKVVLLSQFAMTSGGSYVGHLLPA